MRKAAGIGGIGGGDTDRPGAVRVFAPEGARHQPPAMGDLIAIGAVADQEMRDRAGRGDEVDEEVVGGLYREVLQIEDHCLDRLMALDVDRNRLNRAAADLP